MPKIRSLKESRKKGIKRKVQEFKSNKRGLESYLPFLLFGIVLVVIFGIVVVPSAIIFDKASNEMMETKYVENDSKAYGALNQIQNLVTPLFDQLVFITLIAVLFGTLVLALFTDFHPATVVLFILAVVIFIIVAGLMGNIWNEVATTSQFEDKASEMTLTSAVLGSPYPIIIGVVGLLAILIILHKRGTTQGA